MIVSEMLDKIKESEVYILCLFNVRFIGLIKWYGRHIKGFRDSRVLSDDEA